jgi:hypothetical protein
MRKAAIVGLAVLGLFAAANAEVVLDNTAATTAQPAGDPISLDLQVGNGSDGWLVVMLSYEVGSADTPVGVTAGGQAMNLLTEGFADSFAGPGTKVFSLANPASGTLTIDVDLPDVPPTWGNYYVGAASFFNVGNVTGQTVIDNAGTDGVAALATVTAMPTDGGMIAGIIVGNESGTMTGAAGQNEFFNGELTSSASVMATLAAPTAGNVDFSYDINPGFDRGVISTVGLEVVPEPTTMALLGLGGLAVLRRRKK